MQIYELLLISVPILLIALIGCFSNRGISSQRAQHQTCLRCGCTDSEVWNQVTVVSWPLQLMLKGVDMEQTRQNKWPGCAHSGSESNKTAAILDVDRHR